MSASPQTIEQEVRTAFQSWGDAWNNGDLETYLTGYWDSDETRYVSGSKVVRGYAAITDAYRMRFTSPELMGQLELRHLDITPIADRDAVVFGQIRHTIGNQTQEATFTAHLRKIGGRWLILSDHTAG